MNTCRDGGPIQDNKEKCRRANPITYVTKTDPPMLLMHGELDQAVPFNQSELLYAALREAGVTSTLYKVKQGDHGFRDSLDSMDTLITMALDFFDEHLKSRGTAERSQE